MLIALPAMLFALTRTASPHEPITTKVMFNKEVIRILERNCLSCHAPGRSKSDISLTTYEEARPWAKAIKEEILEKRMPPFQAVRGYGQFRHDYALPQREVEIITSWVEGGAPKGEMKDYPAAVIARLQSGRTWPLGEPDLILQPESETKIAVADEKQDDETRCFLLPTNLKEDRWIVGLDFQPGDARVVQSASFGFERVLRATARPIAIKAVRQQDSAVRQQSSRKHSGCEVETDQLGDWVPATAAQVFPDSAALRLSAGARLVLKVRYHRIGEATTDRSRIGLYFAKAPITKALTHIAIKPAAPVVVPAAATNFKLAAAQVINTAVEAAAIRPLLFPLAKSFEATAYRPDGSIEVLIVAKNYRYDWQPTYFFKRPVILPAGTRIEVTAYLDNSEENRNNPHDPPASMKFADTICELLVASPMAQAMPARH